VLTFFIAGLLYLLRFERVDNLGAYRIPPETGILIPSANNSNRRESTRGMPMGGRKTHDFPHGRPLLLTLILLEFPIALIISAIAFGFKDWRSAAPTLAILIACRHR
jgi:hypothetical protein